MPGLDSAFNLYAKRSVGLEAEELKSFAFELIDNIKNLKPEDGFDLLELADNKQFTPRDKQFVFETLPELSGNTVSKEITDEAKKILGIQHAAVSAGSFSRVIDFVSDQDTDFVSRLLEKSKFSSPEVKDDFISALDIATFQKKFSSEPEDLYHELKDGQLSHAMNVKAITSLPDENRIGIVKMMTSNSILDAAIQKDDLGTFIGHLDSLTDKQQDVLTKIYLEGSDQKGIEFAEKSIDFQTIKAGLNDGASLKDIVQDNKIPSKVVNELEAISPDIKPANPSYSLDTMMSSPSLGG